MKKTIDNMQTVAVYNESRIKTYGFHVVTDLFFKRFQCTPDRLVAMGRGIEALGDAGIGFYLVFAQTAEDHALSLFVLARDDERMRNYMHPFIKDLVDGPSDLSAMVDVVFFQGPHFGDRYGIAHTAFHALEARSLPLLASVCSGACLYLVVPCGKGNEAEGVLRSVFEVPKNRHRQGIKRKNRDGK
jgi:hypothetical protein